MGVVGNSLCLPLCALCRRLRSKVFSDEISSEYIDISSATGYRVTRGARDYRCTARRYVILYGDHLTVMDGSGISVIVPTFNSAREIQACLSSASDCLPHAEFIVVDNGSTTIHARWQTRHCRQ